MKADAAQKIMQNSTLTNGLKIVLAERHTAPVVNFNLLVDSGYASDPSSGAGTASFAQAMLLEGTATRDSLPLGEETAAIGANLGPFRRQCGRADHEGEVPAESSVAGVRHHPVLMLSRQAFRDSVNPLPRAAALRRP